MILKENEFNVTWRRLDPVEGFIVSGGFDWTRNYVLKADTSVYCLEDKNHPAMIL